jgi:hypothetical protein
MEEHMTEKYFAASNSSKGFCSYYGGVFDYKKLSKIYAIKGGPGTGKAFFMREIAKIAEEKGFSVCYIYCSSDAKSLDGIIINELKIAVIDATAPHIYEPKMPGAVESIVNLGQFLNEKMLAKNRKLIENLCNEKQRGFERAYRNLSAYHHFSCNIEDIVINAIKQEKIKKFAEKIAENLEKEQGIEENLLVHSIGMHGFSAFDTYRQNSKIYYEVNDYFDSAHFLMKEIYQSLKNKKANIRISNNPIIPTRLDAIALSNVGLVFEIGNEMPSDARFINMKRFVDKENIASIRQEYRAIARARDFALDLAGSEFENIKKHHFLLEEIYGLAMDFSAKEEFTREFCNNIFENN